MADRAYIRAGNSAVVALAFVIVSLIVLVTMPILIQRSIQQAHALQDESLSPALVTLNDYEEALTSQMISLTEMSRGGLALGLRRYENAVAAERSAERALAMVMPRLGTTTKAAFDSLRVVAAAWRAQSESLVASAQDTRRPVNIASADSLSPLVQEAAERLSAELEARSTTERLRVRSLERYNVELPAVLVPVALASALIALWLGRRLIRLADEAERGRSSLAQLVQARAALMRGVTHDVKNPIGAALGYVDLLRDDIAGPLTEEQRTVLDRLRRQLHASLDTLEQLLDVWMAESRHTQLSIATVDVARLVQELVGDFGASALAAGLELRCDVPGDLPTIASDARRVRQVVGNLVSNAIKYTPAGGHIMVTASRAQRNGHGCIAIAVADNGVGIADADQQRIFEEFYRVPDQAHEARGAGIGLAFSRRTAELLGGTIELRSRVGEGSTFTLLVPEQRDTHFVERRR